MADPNARIKMVLVVEDEIHIADALAYLIEDAGYTARIAHNGKDALAIVAADPPDLVITDLMMPVMDGLTLLHTLRRQSTVLPVVLMSAAGRGHVAQMGADAILGKPFELQEVETLLHLFLG